MKTSTNKIQRDFLDALAREIEIGLIKVSQGDESVFANLMAQFPATPFGIAWEKVHGHRCSPSPQPKPAIGSYIHTIEAFFRSFASDAGIALENNVYIVGDGVTDIILEMPCKLVLKYLHELVSIPQHTFVISKDYRWCFSYTFEDDMYYGESPNPNDDAS